MQLVNESFTTKYKPTTGLLWHKLQITLIKLNERMHHNTKQIVHEELKLQLRHTNKTFKICVRPNFGSVL